MECRDMHLLLGEIRGKLDLVIDNQIQQSDKIDAMATRVGRVERKAALNGLITGSVTGAVAAVGVALAKAKLGV